MLRNSLRSCTVCSNYVSVLPTPYLNLVQTGWCLRRTKSSLSEEQRERLANGPGLEDFVSGYAPQTPDHLVRKKGQRYIINEHYGSILHFNLPFLYSTLLLFHSLRLPEWLKTDIPVGKNFTKLTQGLRELKLNTVSYDNHVSVCNDRMCVGV